MSSADAGSRALRGRLAIWVFLTCAFDYFFSALLRAVTATLAPVFSQELGLGAGQLGLLAGAYFLGFSIMQLPIGKWLDDHGPKRVLISLLFVAVIGCIAFACARTWGQLLVARFIIGVGVAAGLMAPLTLYRHAFDLSGQLRANSWMLMTGSLGMLSSTLPVQALLPVVGWRGLFALAAAMLLVAIAFIWAVVPRDRVPRPQSAAAGPGYAEVFSAPAFRRLAPAAFFSYGGMIAMQSLWIGPWLTQVGGRSPIEAATGLFAVNAGMLLAFLSWGLVMPKLIAAGWDGERLIARAWPLGVLALGWILWRGESAGAADWAVWCVLTSVISLSQPAVAQAFPAATAGKALSAFNLVIFFGVFSIQWGLGALIDALAGLGWPIATAYRVAFGMFLMASLLSFAPIIWPRRTGIR